MPAANKRAPVTPTPQAVSLSRPQFTCALPPSPAAPHEPCRTSSARLMQDARRSRAHDAPQAAGRPDKSGLLGVALRATSSIFDRLPTGSFRCIHSHGPQGRPSRLRRVKSCGLLDSAKPREDGRPPHRVRHSGSFRLRLRLRRDTSLRDGGTPPTGGFFSTRARRQKTVSVPKHGPSLTAPTRHPSDPGTDAECVVFSREARPENKLRIVPPRCGQMSPRRPCRPDRDAFGPPSRPACSPCRHVAAFPDRRARPPPLFPGLSAPMRNASSQERLRPRKLRVIRPSLLACCVAAACRLRQTCRRDRGPVALPRSGCPVRRSRHPAALSKPAHAPPPAAPRASFRSGPAATPQAMAENRRAITQQQQSEN
jgi:hypothetical protein